MTATANILLSLLNESNFPPTPFSALNLQMGEPLVGGPTKNTLLTLTGVSGRGYSGSVDVEYDRILLDDFIVSNYPLRSDENLNQQGLLDFINRAHRLWLELSDFETFTVPSLQPGQSATVNIQLKEESLGWYSSTGGDYSINYEYGRPYLEVVVGKKALSDIPPLAPAGKVNGRMLLWGVDFTSIAPALKVTSQSLYSDFATVLQVAAFNGCPAWLEGTIVDQPTSAVPDSNQSFQRVVVQTNVTSSEVEGPLYFHYNVLGA